MSLELDIIEGHSSPQRERDDIQRRTAALPLPDRGIRAWTFLVGCFMIEAVIWGKMIQFNMQAPY
jgi:hypothetical protein